VRPSVAQGIIKHSFLSAGFWFKHTNLSDSVVPGANDGSGASVGGAPVVGATGSTVGECVVGGSVGGIVDGDLVVG